METDNVPEKQEPQQAENKAPEVVQEPVAPVPAQESVPAKEPAAPASAQEPVMPDPDLPEELAFRKFYLGMVCLNAGVSGSPISKELDLRLDNKWPCVKILDYGLSCKEISMARKEDGLWRLSGTPASEGKIDLHIDYEVEKDEKTLKKDSLCIPLLNIKASPKSMWKNLPTDKNGEYFVEDQDKFLLLPEGKRLKSVVAASLRGRSHAHKGLFRDDSFKCCYLDDVDWYIVAVSDGAGSAEFSRKGSHIMCDTFVERASNLLRREDLANMFALSRCIPMKSDIEKKGQRIIWNAAYEGYKKIYEEAHAKERSIKKYACTFLGVLVKKIGQEYLVVSAYIGDGAIGMLSKGEFISLSTPDGGEQVGETRFATMPEIWGKTQEEQEKIMESRTLCSWIEDFDCLMSMTDGVSDPKFGTDNNLKKLELWEKLWQELKEDVINAKSESSRDDLLVKWLDFYEEGHHDDRTIALIY